MVLCMVQGHLIEGRRVMSKYRVYEIIGDDEKFGYAGYLTACKRSETVEGNYGMDTFIVDKEDISNLLKGRALYAEIAGGEYSILLYMK